MSQTSDNPPRAEIIGPARDINSLEHAAYRANLPVDEPTDYEYGFFPEIHQTPSGTDVFLLIRNTAIAQWHLNITQECVPSDVKNRLRPPFNADDELIDKIVRYLTRHGVINVGMYQRKTHIRHFGSEQQFFAVVIGAGVSGIATALQLVSFGFKVVILEGRQALGGRCKSFNSKGVLIEAGCDLLRDLDCSPIQDLLSQIELQQFPPNPDEIACFNEGVQVEPGREKLIKGMYDNLHGALAYLAQQQEQRDERGYYISRQRAYENVLQIIERKVMLNYYNYCNTSLEIARKRENHFNRMRHHRTVAMMAQKKMELEGAKDALLTKSLAYDIRSAMKAFQKDMEAFDICENHLVNHRKNPCCGQYMLSSDFNNYNFVLGCEELSFGTQLEKVQFSTATAEPDWNGPVTRLENGLSTLLKTLVQQRQIDVRGNKMVTRIDTTQQNCVVLECKDDEGNETVMEAALVVSTLPLGVLKKTIQYHPQAPVFVPPLPRKKVDAIRCMGQAIVNKVILIFERNFWEATHGSTFANVSSDVRMRASMHYWSSTPGSTVLNTYYVGENSLHNSPDDVLVAMAMAVLRKIFPICAPKSPMKAYVTRWHDDPLAFGSGSFKSLRTELHHYTDMIEPLKSGDGVNRVYFAGEHTSLEHCNTIKGAWMSGMRVANEAATDHNGPNWINFGNPEIIDEPNPMPEAVASGLRRVIHRPRQSMPEPVDRPATATATIKKVKPLPPLHQLLNTRGPVAPPRNQFVGNEFGQFIPEGMSNILSTSFAAAFASTRRCAHEHELIDLEDPNQPSTSSAPSRRSAPMLLPAERAYQDTMKKTRALNQARAQQAVSLVPRPGMTSQQHLEALRHEKLVQVRKEAAVRAAAARAARAKQSSVAGPSTSGPRPSTSQYMSSRPSTSAYANPARQVPPTRHSFDFPSTSSSQPSTSSSQPSTSSSQPSTSRGTPRLPERPPSSSPAKPPGSRMQGARK